MNSAVYIKESISMQDVLSMYGYDSKKNRIPCPIHGGTHPNMAVTDRSFRCFVCGSSGSVIDFVMGVFDLSFSDAVRKIDRDFNLGLTSGISPAKQAVIDAKVEARRKYQAELDHLERAWLEAFDLFAKCDLILCKERPTSWEDMSDEYVWALQNKAIAQYKLDQAEIDLWLHKHPEDKIVKGEMNYVH